jgi:ribose/xylose/arabinose/galactoside ABC-type transport system permease subunit
MARKGQPLPLAAKTFIATALLVIFGGIVAPSTISASAIFTMLPFAAILAVASIGQHLVVQQRGLDLSVAGTMSFAAVIVTRYPSSDAGAGETLAFVGVALLMGAVVGALNGLLVALLRVPALVTTIGMNSLLFGVTRIVSRSSASPAPEPLNWLGVNRLLGIPATMYAMLIIAGLGIFLLAKTGIGRRFVAISVNPSAAVAVGIRLTSYRLSTYLLAGFCYSAAGVMLAAYLQTPTVLSGLPYMLATVAAVVVGGNPIEGGRRGSLAATVIGAFFLTFLGQLVLAFGFGTSSRNIVEALIIVTAIALPELTRRVRRAYG